MLVEEWDGAASAALVAGLRGAVYPPEVLATIVWAMVAPLGGQAPLRGQLDLCGLPW